MARATRPLCACVSCGELVIGGGGGLNMAGSGARVALGWKAVLLGVVEGLAGEKKEGKLNPSSFQHFVHSRGLAAGKVYFASPCTEFRAFCT